jgi:hypothetical protein
MVAFVSHLRSIDEGDHASIRRLAIHKAGGRHRLTNEVARQVGRTVRARAYPPRYRSFREDSNTVRAMVTAKTTPTARIGLCRP